MKNLFQNEHLNKEQLSLLDNHLRSGFDFSIIIGKSEKIVLLLKLISQIADTVATVLIHGESGTGKELIAKALHFNSSRRKKPFVPINCGAMPDNLLESEFFGHVRGAFTGAVQDKIGWFEHSNTGTIFLDEVQEMSKPLQIKLLRVLQSGEYSYVGSTKLKKCDVRIIVATTTDLKVLIKQGKFRKELFYRLNVVDIEIAPLRDRKSDIPILIDHFMNMFNKKYNKNIQGTTKDAKLYFLNYNYPGNIRELKNIIERAVILSGDRYITENDLPICLTDSLTEINKIPKFIDNFSSFKLRKKQVLEKFEKEYIIECLASTNGNISQAASIADLHFSNFYSKMKKYNICSHKFKI